MIDLEKFSSRNVWGNYLGLSRSSIAFGTFLTLVFNPLAELITGSGPSTDPLGISIFTILSQHLTLAKVISLSILALVVIGWRPRYTSVFHWWITYSFASSANIIDGGDHISVILTSLLLPLCLTDSRKWHWQSLENINTTTIKFAATSITAQIAIFIIKIQISFIYLHSAVAKTRVTEWMDGTALYYWFKHPVFGGNDFILPILSPLINNEFISTYLTWFVIIFEFFLFAGIFMDNKLKPFFMALAISFHFLIFLIHGLSSFFFTMSGALILYFAPTYNSATITRLASLINNKTSIK